MESDTMELLRLMLAHLRPRLQGRDEEGQACAAHFFLGLQMGLDLGKLNYLREE